MRMINEVIIHCSATKAGREVSVREITEWHKKRGFVTCGYHYVIHLDGSIECARKIEQYGAHCHGRNRESIGVCYIGGLDEQGRPSDTRTDKQKQALKTLIDYLIYVHKDITRISGHNEYSLKACPCFNVRDEYMPISNRTEHLINAIIDI